MNLIIIKKSKKKNEIVWEPLTNKYKNEGIKNTAMLKTIIQTRSCNFCYSSCFLDMGYSSFSNPLNNPTTKSFGSNGSKSDLHLPVKLVGLGEGIDDLEPFDPNDFVVGLFKGLLKEE